MWRRVCSYLQGKKERVRLIVSWLAAAGNLHSRQSRWEGTKYRSVVARLQMKHFKGSWREKVFPLIMLSRRMSKAQDWLCAFLSFLSFYPPNRHAYSHLLLVPMPSPTFSPVETSIIWPQYVQDTSPQHPREWKTDQCQSAAEEVLQAFKLNTMPASNPASDDLI